MVEFEAMNVSRLFLRWVGWCLAMALVLAACEQSASARDQAAIKAILQRTLVEYNRPVFAKRMEKAKTPLAALRYALSIQEKFAAEHGLTFEQYVVRLRSTRGNPQVATLLGRVERQINAHQKFSDSFFALLENMDRSTAEERP